jgi:hypothetical protein
MTTSLSFSNFQFKTIGQQPELLKRISAPNPEDLDRFHSRSISPVLPKELPSDSSPDSELSTQPSLRARLSLADRLMIDHDVQMEDVSSDQPTTLHTRSLTTPAVNLASTNQSLNKDVTAGTAVSANGRSRPPHITMNVSGVPSPHHAHNSPITSSLQPSNLSRSSSGRSNPGVNPQTSARPSSLQLNAAASISRPGTPNTLAANLTTEVPPFATLRQLQARIASSIASLKPVSTEHVLLLAQSLKEQQRGILTSVHSAQTIAQQALYSAQASVTACLDCLKAAESTQVQIDEVVAAIENIGGHASGWNVGLEALRDDFRQLKAWARDLEINEAQRQRDFKETEAKRRSQERIPQPQGPSTKRLGSSLSPRPAQAPAINPNLSPSSSVLVSVEHEADAAARAWDQLREQSAERRRLAEAELRKHREAEERLEQEQKQAQALVEAREAELAHLRTERIEAEQREKARQQKEAEEAELKRKELDRMREEAIQFQLAQRKASEERRNAEENEKAFQAAKAMAAKRLAEEQKRRDIEARDTLARRREGERAKAEAEVQRQHLLQEQEVKRQEIVAQKHRANVETAKKIHAERAKEKQANRSASIDKIITPPHQNTPPPPGQSTVAANSSKFDLGNTLTTSPAGGPDGKGTGVSAKFQPGDTSTSRPFPTSPKVCRGDLQSPDSLSGLNPANNVVKATDPNSNQPKYINATQRQRSAPIANGLTTFHEYDSWVIPSTSPRQPATTAFVDSIGSDVGIIPLIPRSLVPPISPEAQKANLRRLANGLSSPTIKRDPDEGKLAKGLERNSALPLKVQELTNVPTTSNPPVEIGLRKPKEEPPTDIPLLSLPSPSPSKHTKVASTCQPFHSEPARARSQNSSQQKQSDASGPAVGNVQPSTQSTAGSIITTSTPVDISTTSSTGEQQVTVASKPNVVSLPRPPLPMPMSQSFSAIAHDLAPNDPFDNLLASRMGPDASLSTNGWSIPSPVQEDAPDLRFRVRAARPPGLDHYSPPPSSANTRGPTRSRPIPRRVDHYSPPRRAPERQPPAHNDYARSRSRSGGSNGNDSRCASPDPRIRHHGRRDDEPADILPPNLLGQKRQRVDEHPGGPPTRRPRFGADINNESAPRIGTAKLPYSSQQPEDEWSHLANYERSPTPEPRVTPLFNRIEDPPPTSPGFRGDQARGGQALNSYRPDSQNDRRPAFKQHTASQGQPPYSNHPYHSNNPQRQNFRNPEDGSRPNLLNRFTDSAQPAQVDADYPPPRNYRARPPKPFGRGGAHPPLEQRLSNHPNNPSLMTRMQGPTGHQRPNHA